MLTMIPGSGHICGRSVALLQRLMLPPAQLRATGFFLSLGLQTSILCMVSGATMVAGLSVNIFNRESLSVTFRPWSPHC
jgi:hypothetical protein